MQDYYQPDFYHFNEDSIHVVNYALKVVRQNTKLLSVADLYSGSGIIGFEFWKRFSKVKKIIFSELQSDFKPFWDRNLKLMIENSKREHATFLLGAVSSFLDNKNYKAQFDLILANPPYFNKKSGKYSLNKKRNLCRFNLIDKPEVLFEVIFFTLKKDGKAIVSLRDDIQPSQIKNLKILNKVKYSNCYVFELEHC